MLSVQLSHFPQDFLTVLERAGQGINSAEGAGGKNAVQTNWGFGNEYTFVHQFSICSDSTVLKN